MTTEVGRPYVESLVVSWEGVYFRARRDSSGVITELYLNGDGRSYEYDVADDKTAGGKKFPALDAWKKFSKTLFARVTLLDGTKCVDTSPWEYVGASLTPHGSEYGWNNPRILIFKNGGQWIAISEHKWMDQGESQDPKFPKVGEKVLIGRHLEENLFFPVLRTDGDKFSVQFSVMKTIQEAEIVKEKERAENK